MQVAVPLLVKHLELGTSGTFFVAALGSSETIASDSSILTAMTRCAAKAATAPFISDAITKKAHPPLHNFYTAAKRREILDAAEYRSAKIPAKSVMIFDDFITTGDTLSHIAEAIHAANNGVTVFGVALAKTERRAYHKDRFGIDLSNDHVPKKWEAAWDQGEAQ